MLRISKVQSKIQKLHCSRVLDYEEFLKDVSLSQK